MEVFRKAGAAASEGRNPFEALFSLHPPPAPLSPQSAVRRFGPLPYLGTRVRSPGGTLGAYTWTSYAAAAEARRHLGAGLRAAGISPGERVGIHSVNCAEWVLVDHACSSQGIVTVSLYDTLGPDVVRFIANHAELAAVAWCASRCEMKIPCMRVEKKR